MVVAMVVGGLTMLMGEGGRAETGAKGSRGFCNVRRGRGKLASPVRSHSRSREQKQEGGLSLACRVLQGGISPLVDPGSALSPACPACQRRCDPHSPDHLLLSLGAKRGRRNCGAADGACVSASGTRRDMIGPPQAAMFLGRAPPGVLDVPGQGK